MLITVNFNARISPTINLLTGRGVKMQIMTIVQKSDRTHKKLAPCELSLCIFMAKTHSEVFGEKL